jgi:MFS transporter, OFA family, oxalate/formate antiporter
MSGKRVFFGWWVLLGIFSSYTALVGVQVYTLPLFYPEIIRELGWTPEQVARPATIFFLTGALVTPFVSSLYDWYSVRLFMCVGACATIIGLLAFSTLQTPTHMIMIFLVLALAQVCSGQVPTMLVITRWFRRYRGIAVGITLMGTSFGAAIFPLVVRQVMLTGDWRDAVRILTIICAVMMILPLIFLIRSRPEDKGLHIDGDDAGAVVSSAQPAEQRMLVEGPTLREALHMPAFYILAVATGALWFCINGIVQHAPIFLGTDMGLSMKTLPLIISVTFWFAIVGKLLFGWLSDRFNKVIIMFLGVINLILGLLILRLSSADNMVSLYAYAAVFGIGFSGMFTMIQLVIAEFFAGKSYGKILGILTMIDVGSGGLAIEALARMRSAFGSYLPVIELLMGVCCVVAVMVIVLWRIRLNMPGKKV